MEVVLLAAVHNKEKSCHLARPVIVGDRSQGVNFHQENGEDDDDEVIVINKHLGR